MKPVLLLVPGVLCNATVWERVAEALRSEADIRVSLPLEDSIAAMAESAWAKVADVPAEVPLVLAGFSLGGFVALDMLARPVRAIQAAALISASGRPESPEGAIARGKTIAALGRDFPRTVEGILQFASPGASGSLAADLRRMMHEVGPDTGIRQNRAAQAREDHRAALPGLRLPVAVLCGTQDRVTPPDRSRELADLIPGARLELFEGAGHMLPREQPDFVARALRALLPAQEPGMTQ